MYTMPTCAARLAFLPLRNLSLAAALLLAGCASSDDLERTRQESAQAKAKMSAELQQERQLAASMQQESEAKKAEAEKLALALGGTSHVQSASLGASGSCPNNTLTNQLAIQLVNDSGLDDSQVFVLLSAAGSTIGWPSGTWPSGGSPPPGTLSYYDSTTSPTVTAGALSNLKSSICGTITSPYTGNTLNVYQFSVAAISGGRLMVSYPGGGGTGASGTATLSSTGAVTGVKITNGGSGYTTPPAVTFSAPPSGGTTATGTAILSSTGAVTGVNISNGGRGYTSAPTVTITTAVAVYNGNFPTGQEPYRWDKMEFGYPGSGADLTSMDFFSIPMQFDYRDGNNNVLHTMSYYTSTKTLLKHLAGLSTSTMTGASGAFLPTTWTLKQGASGFYRVFGPSLLVSNSPTGSPAPYPSFGPYLKTLVGQAFTVKGTGNSGCANQVSYSYKAQFASDGQGGYTVTMTDTGSLMQNGPPCGVPPGAITAQGTAIISPGEAVTGVTITNPGSDYFSGAPTVTFSGGGGSGAQGTANLAADGSVSGVIISSGGSSYTSVPTVTFSAPRTPPKTVTLPPDLIVTIHLPAPSANSGYDVNLYGVPATAFSVPTTGMNAAQIASIPNSLYAVIAGDFMAGMNFGYAGKGSNAPQNTANWYSNPPTLYPFGGARTTNDGYYNPYAAVFYNLSDAYGFAYSDRGGRPSPFVSLPSNATTMRITLLNDTRLDAPQVTVSNPAATSLTISWPPSSPPTGYSATGYTVNVGYGGGTAPIQTQTTQSTSLTISNLSPGTTYQISVTATATGANSIQSYTVPVYGTTTGTMAQPGGTLQFFTSLNWSVNASGVPPQNYTFTINGSTYTVGGPNASIAGAIGTNVYGLTITDGSNTVYQGNYVVNLSQNNGNYYLNSAFLTPPNSNPLTPGWNGGHAPPYPGGPITPIQSLVIGTPFAPVATKQASTVCFPGNC